MPRIPIIEQSTNVATTTPSPQAQGQQVVSPMGNAGAVAAQGLDYLAEAEVRNRNALTLKENADAIANTGKPLSDADVYWKQYLTDAPKTTVDGGLVKQDDGTTVGFREKASKDFDTWAASFMAPITNEKAKVYAQNHINNLRTQVLDNAITFEAKAGVANRAAKVDESVGNWAKQAAGDTSPPDQLVKNVTQLVTNAKTLIANSGFDEATRNQKAIEATRAIVQAANTGAMNRDPVAYKNAALAIYGIDPTVPAGSGSSTGSGPSAAVTRNADGTVSLATDPNLPAGMRNNNPGNIVYVNQKDALGPSVNRDNGGKSAQAVYATPDDGMAAMFQLALKKYDGGKTTANAIIASQGGWTPGNTAAAANVAKTMGLAPDDDINLRDPAMLKKFGRALMLQEHGSASAQYSDGMVSRIADDVLAGRKVTPSSGAPSAPARAPANPQLVSLVGQLPVEQLPAYISHANTLVNQQQAVLLTTFQESLRDSAARADQGIPDKTPRSEAEFVGLLGPEKGSMAYREYADKQQYAAQVASLTTSSPEEFQALLASRKAIDPQSPGYAAASENTTKLEMAWDRVVKMRTEDPAAYTLRYSDGVKKAYGALIDAKTADQTTAAAAAFATTTMAEQQRLGVLKPQILPKSYADQIVSQFYKQEDGGQNAAQLVQQLASTWGNKWPEVFRQISSDLPPVAKVLGTLGPEVSPATKSLLASTAKMKMDDLRSGMDTKTAGDIDDKLVSTFGDFKKSMAFQTGGLSTFDTMFDSAKRLAYVYHSQGMKPADASTRAFDNLIGKSYQFLGTARVPVTYDLSAIERGTEIAQDAMDKLDILVPPHPAGIPEAFAKTQYINGLRTSGQSTWVTDANEKGLVLYDVVSNTPVKLKNGEDLRFDWGDLMQKGGPSMLQRLLGQTPQGMPPPIENKAIAPDLSKTKDNARWNK